MDRGALQIVGAIALLGVSAAASGAAARKPAAPQASTAARSLAQNCDAHRFETTIELTGADGKPKQSKVRMCGTEGQSDADWIRTLKDAVKKTADSQQMPPGAKEQIIAAVNAEIARLSTPGLALPQGADISKLPKSAAAKPEVPITRDYGALPPLPTANVEPPHLIGPGAIMAQVPRLTLRCALVGDEDRPTECGSIDRDTVLVVKADEPFPSGLQLHFVRHGDDRAELKVPALKPGQTANLRLPAAVCAGVVRSRVEIQAAGTNAPSGTLAGPIGEYDLRC